MNFFIFFNLLLFLHQAGALVHVYTDGSILVTHGGTEMGQGLHTKMVQVSGKGKKTEKTKQNKKILPQNQVTRMTDYAYFITGS